MDLRIPLFAATAASALLHTAGFAGNAAQTPNAMAMARPADAVLAVMYEMAVQS